MAESAVTETASPDKQPDLTGQAKKTIQTKGNVVIFAMDGSDIAINALKCEFTILYLIYDYISFYQRFNCLPVAQRLRKEPIA